MKTSINTVNGTIKLIYGQLALQELSEQDLERLRSDIWVALMEISLAKGQVCSMCGEFSSGQLVCRDCEIGCEMTDYNYDRLAEVI